VALSRGNAQHMTGEGSEEQATLYSDGIRH
jgi:hypothetical protein